MDIRLIAMDMDGTLLNGEQKISRANLQALHRATEAGVHIAFCSGRMTGDASGYAADAGLPGCHILALNGACALERPNGELLWARCLPTQALDELVGVLLEAHITFGCFEPNRVTAMPYEQLSERDRKIWGTQSDRPGAPSFAAGMAAYRAARKRGVCKVVCFDDDDPALLERVGERVRAIRGLEVTSSWRNNWEMMPVDVGKGMAVRLLAERLGLGPEQVMTLGDYDNDLSMIAYAGCGVAMGNAAESVKRSARYVTDTNLNDGVAKAIQQYALS